MKLKEFRWNCCLTQGGLAKALGCSQAEISRVENGGAPSLNFRRVFLSTYGVEETEKIDELKKRED